MAAAAVPTGSGALDSFAARFAGATARGADPTSPMPEDPPGCNVDPQEADVIVIVDISNVRSGVHNVAADAFGKGMAQVHTSPILQTVTNVIGMTECSASDWTAAVELHSDGAGLPPLQDKAVYLCAAASALHHNVKTEKSIMNKAGFNCSVEPLEDERKHGGSVKEKHVDSVIGRWCQETATHAAAAKAGGKQRVLILFSGDGKVLPGEDAIYRGVEAALEAGMQVHVVAFTDSMSGAYKPDSDLEQAHRGLLFTHELGLRRDAAAGGETEEAAAGAGSGGGVAATSAVVPEPVLPPAGSSFRGWRAARAPRGGHGPRCQQGRGGSTRSTRPWVFPQRTHGAAAPAAGAGEPWPQGNSSTASASWPSRQGYTVATPDAAAEADAAPTWRKDSKEQ